MNSSKPHLVGITLGAVILVIASSAVGYWFARSGVHVPQRQPLYWYDPMVPNQHFDKPGKSPYMDMELVPKYADQAEGVGAVASIEIDPRIVQNLGVRTTEVEHGVLSQPIEALGTLTFDQRTVAVVQARSNGFVTKVYSLAPGDVIGRDAPIVDLLVPDWAGAQREFLALSKAGDRDLVEAGRQRLLLLGMSPELIRGIEEDQQPRTTITIRSPRAGVIESLEVREGMTVSTGSTLARINGLATVWLEAAIREGQIAHSRPGSSVDVRLTAYPGESFEGRVIAILPQANTETRTVRVRIELPNRENRLRPGMFAQVRLDNESRTPVLYVASESIIRTGTRTVVIVMDDQGRFTPTEVKTGADFNGRTVILAGLAQGQRVVASGQFLIDSEASLKGVLARLAAKQGTAP